ncbi:nicotinamide riboside transporter PnuC [Stenotrophomonas geniculata]|uniref:nicotinamide riboside transporter PnuC n=1 Tax=Stenotrophomonas geniculata TaxID=86188 RepID=UPI002E7A50DC|nr:nicotinamide riboside transporter PnuC [Stenotrophomonas geniculata]
MNLSDPNFQLELAANIAVAGSILLAGRNNVHTWWLGIVGCALFAAVFERSHLYADMVLQFFFIAISVLGWWQWLRGDHGAPLPITALRPRAWAWLLPLAVVATFGYGWMLTRLTNAYAPYIDSAVLVLSVIAQILMMRRKLESWWVWLLVNTVAVPLYYSRGLHLTSILYVGFWINALVALRHWRNLMRV